MGHLPIAHGPSTAHPQPTHGPATAQPWPSPGPAHPSPIHSPAMAHFIPTETNCGQGMERCWTKSGQMLVQPLYKCTNLPLYSFQDSSVREILLAAISSHGYCNCIYVSAKLNLAHFPWPTHRLWPAHCPWPAHHLYPTSACKIHQSCFYCL